MLAAFQNTSRGPCIGIGYSTVTSNRNEDLLPASTLLGIPLELADPSNERYGPMPGGAADLAGCGILGGVLAPGLFRWRAMNYWMGGVAPENASGGSFPPPDGEAQGSGPGFGTIPALGGLSTIGGVEVSFFSPEPVQFEVAHYVPGATDDLSALLGASSLRPSLVSEPVRIWDFSFADATASQIVFAYDADELIGPVQVYGLNADSLWVALPSWIDSDAETIRVSTTGFSRFALGVRRQTVPVLTAPGGLVLVALLVCAAAVRMRAGSSALTLPGRA